MTQLKKTITVPFNVAQMYEMVIDLEKYPEFLPWCTAARVDHKTLTRIQATLRGHKMRMDFVFGVYYQLQQNKTVTVHLLNKGPFKQIEASWRFDALGEGRSQFTFELKFEFISKLLAWTLTPLIKSEAGKLINECVARAKMLYG